MNGKIRTNVRIGDTVNIVLKNNQKTGKLTNGTVQQILTNTSSHPHGIKVRLTTGEVGRVKEVIHSLDK